MNPKLTDQAVSELPLSAGRAELLEEIMSSSVLDDTVSSAPAASRRPAARWVVPLGAAAAVAALASASVWWPSGETPSPQPSEPAPAAASRAATPSSAPEPKPEPKPEPAPTTRPSTGHLAVLEAPGWTLEHLERTDQYGELSYSDGQRYLSVSWYPASSYASYVEDREHISDPPAPGEPVEVLDLAGQMWHYGPQDHTVIRKPQNGHWMEFRGSGVDQATYLALLDALRMVDDGGLDAALTEDHVTDAERPREIARLLAEIRDASGAGLPAGAEPIVSTQSDPYHLGADVAGGYACRWLDQYVAASAAGDRAEVDQATAVLGTARQWPVLKRMAAEGGYSDVVWEYADDVVAGRVPEGYQGGLGC